MEINQIVMVTDIFKLLSDPTRVKILDALFRAKGGLCVYEIAEIIEMSQSATSHQLAKLEDKGLVLCFRHGQTMCYEMEKTETTKRIEKLIYSCT